MVACVAAAACVDACVDGRSEANRGEARGEEWAGVGREGSGQDEIGPRGGRRDI